MSALPIRDEPSKRANEFDNLGEISNVLNILSPDFTHFYPKRLLEIYSNASNLAEMLDLHRTQIYAKKGLPLKKGSSLRKRIIQLVIASDLAFTLLDCSQEKTCHWLTAPNFLLFGDTPLEVIMRDEGEELISWLMTRLGLKPGAAF